jgi:hypothetical protein
MSTSFIPPSSHAPQPDEDAVALHRRIKAERSRNRRHEKGEVGSTVQSWSRSCRGWIWEEEGWTMGRIGRTEDNRGRIGRDEVDEYQEMTSTSYDRHAWYCELDGEPQLWQHYHHGAVQPGVFPMVLDMQPYVPSATTASIRIQEDEEYQCICRPSFDLLASASC